MGCGKFRKHLWGMHALKRSWESQVCMVIEGWTDDNIKDCRLRLTYLWGSSYSAWGSRPSPSQPYTNQSSLLILWDLVWSLLLCMHAHADVYLNIHKFIVWSCTHVIDLSFTRMMRTQTNTQSWLPPFIRVVPRVSCRCPRRPAGVTSKGNLAGTESLAVDQAVSVSNMHTNSAFKRCACKQTHTRAAAGVSQFSVRLTGNCWLYSHSPPAPSVCVTQNRSTRINPLAGGQKAEKYR